MDLFYTISKLEISSIAKLMYFKIHLAYCEITDSDI